MSYAQLSKDELLVEVERLLQENRDLNDRSAQRERLLEELSTHQVELETQNRELREAHVALEESLSRSADLCTELRKTETETRAAHEYESQLRARFEGLDRAWLRISQALGDPATGLRPVLSSIVEQARVITGAEYAAIGIGRNPDCPFEPWIASGMEPAVETAIGRRPRPVGVLGAVVHEDKTLCLRDVREHPSFLGFPPHHPIMASFIGIPIHDHGQTNATLYLAKKPGAEAFNPDDVRTVEMLAYRAGVALDLAQLHELEARERGRLSMLAETGRLLSSTLDQTASLRVLARLPVPWLADCCLVYLVDGDEVHDAGCAHADPDKERVLAELQHRVQIDRNSGVSLVAQAWRTGKALIASKYSSAQLESHIPDPSLVRLVRDLSATSVIAVPIVVREETLAIIVLGCVGSKREYSQEDLPHAEELAQRAGFMLENARLFRQAQAAIRARDNLLAFVSHDLKGSLSAVRLCAGVLAHPVPGKDNRKSVDVIVRAADRMSCLIDDLLDAATIEAGRFTVQASAADVAHIVQELVLDMEPLAATRSLQLEVVSTGPLPPVNCDRRRVLQVLANLMGNAIKFAPEGSTIRIESGPSDEEVGFAVCDSGSGIAEEDIPHLFDRYWKGTPSEGSGLGLYIARGIVEAHGGRIWVETKPGCGSTFRFTLPAARAAPSSP